MFPQGGHPEAAGLLLRARQEADTKIPESNHGTLSGSVHRKVGVFFFWSDSKKEKSPFLIMEKVSFYQFFVRWFCTASLLIKFGLFSFFSSIFYYVSLCFI
jgi:hypothetical protein